MDLAAATDPCPRINMTECLPNLAANALPKAALRISISVAGPPTVRISNTGTPSPRKLAMWFIGRNGTLVSANGMIPAEWLCTTAMTSGRTL